MVGELAKKERNIGLDFLRILAMFLITARHYIGYSYVAESMDFFSVNGVLLGVFLGLTRMSTNLFVLISGYFLVNSTFKLKRIIRIWTETFFYSVVFFIIGIILNNGDFSITDTVFAIFPVLSRHYWFSVAYLALVLVSPFLNKMIKAITEKEHRMIVIGGAIIFSAWTTFVYFSQGVLTGGNKGLLWCIYLYLIGAYINLYKEKIKFNVISAIVIAISFAVPIVYTFLKHRIPFLENFRVVDDESIFCLIGSVVIFIVFLNIRVNNKRIRDIIIAISKASFGIYLIQENCMIREYLWCDLVNAQKFADSWLMFVILLVCFVVLVVLSFVCERVFSVIYNKCYIIVDKIVLKVRKNET